jgi:predicted translin family RNA/ssDNA-binding protein
MEEVEITRLMKELVQLLQNISEEGEVKSEDEIAERVEAIKRELGAWFIDGCPIYQAS